MRADDHERLSLGNDHGSSALQRSQRHLCGEDRGALRGRRHFGEWVLWPHRPSDLVGLAEHVLGEAGSPFDARCLPGASDPHGLLGTGLRSSGASRARATGTRRRRAQATSLGTAALSRARQLRKLALGGQQTRCMMGKSSTGKRALSEARRQRLAAQLRANLAKRKVQARARAAVRASVHQVADNSNEKGR